MAKAQTGVITHQAAAGPPGKFVDVTTASGVHFQGQAYHTAKKYLIETMGSGVALFDYDSDGRLDIFFANGAPLIDPTAPIRRGMRTTSLPIYKKTNGAGFLEDFGAQELGL